MRQISFGKIIVNKGAKEALLAEKSLLPVGVVDVKKKYFQKGDVISILDEEHNEIARVSLIMILTPAKSNWMSF